MVGEKQYRDLIERLEQDFKKNPKSFKTKVVLQIIAGFGYLFAIVAVVIFILWYLGAALFEDSKALTLAAKGFFVAAPVGIGFLWALGKSLWVEFELPNGHVVTSDEAPKLFKMLDSLRQKSGCQKIHKVMLCDELNACIM